MVRSRQMNQANAYLAGKPCPKCRYVRTSADVNPDWQCPRCQIAYAKYRPGAAQLSSRLVAGGRELATEAKADRSVYALIAANVLALLIAYFTHMSLRELMLVYWMQSVIIGVASFIRILSLDRFDTANFRIGNRPVEETTTDKMRVAVFFLLHYGIFHLVYFMFLVFDPEHDPGDTATGYLLCALVFALNHGYSLLQNIRRDAGGRPNLGTLMFLPYARIIPMHLTIIFGGLFSGGAWAFALFGALKVAADAVMHTVEHHILAKGSALT
mgnify:CR=1 FL=1